MYGKVSHIYVCVCVCVCVCMYKTFHYRLLKDIKYNSLTLGNWPKNRRLCTKIIPGKGYGGYVNCSNMKDGLNTL